jgi:hypothetical protein
MNQEPKNRFFMEAWKHSHCKKKKKKIGIAKKISY